MIRKACFILFLAMFFGLSVSANDWKTWVHISTVPLIDGGAVYSSVKIFQDSEETNTRASAVANLSVLGVQTTLGLVRLFGKEDIHPTVQLIHRIVGYCLVGTAIWMSVAVTDDDAISGTDRGVAYGYTGLTLVPHILFTF